MINWRFAREVGWRKWATRLAARQLDKRVWRRDSRMVLPTGLPIILPRSSHSAGEVFVTAADMDWGAEAVFARFADPARDFFDVGAHIGYYSLYLAPLVRRAVAFEPDPRNLPLLAANLRLASNATLVDKAVSATSGIVRFAADGDTAVSRIAAEGRAVEAISIDDYVRATGTAPALIKIDIEGHDVAALEGASETLSRCQPLVVTELTREAGSSNDTDRLWALLERVGYVAYAPMWRQPRRPWGRLARHLAAIDRARLETARIKMLFLVPARLQPDFAALAASDAAL